MNPAQIDQVRDALRRDTQHIEPVGLGAETVQRRGRSRRNRGRALAAVTTATCMAGVGVVVTRHEGAQDKIAVTGSAPGSGTAPTLAFRTVAGTVSFTSTQFTTAEGVTYKLSTSPASTGKPNSADQAIYSTTDGEHWTTADQGRSWIADLTERDGVLYAIGSAPGATADDVAYKLATSHDGGQAWTDAELPFDVSAPNATVPLTHSASVQVARGSSATVALMTEAFWPNLDALVAQRAAGRVNVSTRQTDAGFELVDLSACAAAKNRAVTSAGVADPKTFVEGKCAEPPSVGTITWSEIGLTSAADLRRQQMLVSTDGTHWSPVTAPDAGYVRDLVATDDGFLLLSENVPAPTSRANRPTMSTSLLRSTDARHWTAASTPPALNVTAIAGNRVIGIDSTGTVHTSTDDGQSWHATSAGAQLPAGAPNTEATTADAGPLGFAVLVGVDQNPNDNTRGHDYLLFSSDGVSWSTKDLATSAPANSYPMQVTVGKDHVSVTYEGPGPKSNGSMEVTTLVGTPER